MNDKKPDPLLKFHLGSTEDWVNTFKNITKGIKRQSHLLKIIAFIATLSALFLQVNIDSIYLNRIQVFFLLSLFILLLWLSIKLIFIILSSGDEKIYIELYVSLIFIPLFASVALMLCLLLFLIENFYQELIFYSKVLFMPILGVISSLLLIFIFKFIKKVKNIDGQSLENYFIFVVYFIVMLRYFHYGFDISATIKSFLSWNFNNIYLIYIFLIYFLQDLICATKRKKLSTNLWILLILILLCITPIVINYLFTYFIY